MLPNALKRQVLYILCSVYIMTCNGDTSFNYCSIIINHLVPTSFIIALQYMLTSLLYPPSDIKVVP